MLPKDGRPTRSSRSSTSERPRPPAKGGKGAAAPVQDLGLQTPVQFVKGVGPRLSSVLSQRAIDTVGDLLTFFPRAYEDRSRFAQVSDLVDGEAATLTVTVRGRRVIPVRMRRKGILEVRCSDATGEMALKFFHFHPAMEARFVPGTEIIVTGKIKRYLGRPEMVHPEITWGKSVAPETARPGASARPAASDDEEEFNVGRLVPVYTEIEGIPSRQFRRMLWHSLERWGARVPEDLPARLRARHVLPTAAESIRNLHFPPTPEEGGRGLIESLVQFTSPWHQRLIYEEFLKFEYLVLRQRLNMDRQAAPALDPALAREAAKALREILPFPLTGDQARAIDEVLTDLSRPHPMNRLIQGDVGSGKTAVAFLVSGAVLATGGQAALMAPTEILAEQHYKNAVKLFGGRLNVALLTGKTTAAQRKPLLARLAAGEPVLLIGTHALLEDPVVFANLQLILIDEQHRFGVEQRRTLRLKGTRKNGAREEHPHQLVLTATPIPRTLALTAYGDLAVTTLKELPPGRTPVKTHVVTKTGRARAYEEIRSRLREGRQAYFIYPLVNDSEAEGFENLASVMTSAESLARDVYPEFKIGVLHGQMKPEEKSAVMEQFARNQIQILVATTVVEVGVDVPNATVIVVEHAERFGLSQLHQLRGRVGRGRHASVCFLFAAEHGGETALERMRIMEKTNDGFEIAEADLEIRGPGEFLGTRQSGVLPFRMANLIRDRDWLLKAREDAQELLKNDPNLEQEVHLPLRLYYQREGKIQFERLRTS